MSMTHSAPLSSRGQSLTELALLLPVLLFLILGAVDVAQVLSAQQHLENAAYLGALRLRNAPSLRDSTRLAAFMKAESGLAPVTAGTTYSIGGAGANQVVVTATSPYTLLLPGLAKLLTAGRSNGTWTLTVSAASIAATDPPIISHNGASVNVQVNPIGGTTDPGPTPLALTCALYEDVTPVPTPQPCSSTSGATFHASGGTTHNYTATVMQVNGITSPPSTPHS